MATPAASARCFATGASLAPSHSAGLTMAAAANENVAKTITYVPVSAWRTNHPASASACLAAGTASNRSSAARASGKNCRCRSWICGSLVRVNALNARSVPLTAPASPLPVHRDTTMLVVHPVNAKPSMSTRLCASTGEAPAHRSGAASIDCANRWSE